MYRGFLETVITDGNAFTACGRIPSSSMRPSSQCHGILYLCHAVQAFQQVNGCAFASTMYQQYPKQHGISVCLWKTKDKEKLYKAGHYLGIIGMLQ